MRISDWSSDVCSSDLGECCFNTKLGRIIQEQGRPQLKAFNGNLWGTAKKPMCRGFTPEEFQALDFSKIDLSEYYADIEARAQSDIQLDMGERVNAYLQAVNSSEERRVGKEGVSTCSSRWSPDT